MGDEIRDYSSSSLANQRMDDLWGKVRERDALTRNTNSHEKERAAKGAVFQYQSLTASSSSSHPRHSYRLYKNICIKCLSTKECTGSTWANCKDMSQAQFRICSAAYSRPSASLSVVINGTFSMDHGNLKMVMDKEEAPFVEMRELRKRHHEICSYNVHF